MKDSTGIVLIPGDGGRSCPGNGEHEGIECCCDECEYAICCLDILSKDIYNISEDWQHLTEKLQGRIIKETTENGAADQEEKYGSLD